MKNHLKKGLGRGLSSLLGDSSKKIDTNKILINLKYYKLEEEMLPKGPWKF